MSFNVVSKLHKTDLNIIYSEYVWPQRLSDWQNNAYMWRTNLYKEPGNNIDDERIDENEKDDECTHLPSENDEIIFGPSTFHNEIENGNSFSKTYTKDVNNNISDVNTDFSKFFYIPAYSSRRQQYEVSCVDSSHLLTRTRRKCCKRGLDGCSNNAWRSVAKSSITNLSLAMIDCVLDQMSVPTAVSHFSEAVENEMKSSGYSREASLCRYIRNWWEAEDKPGIPALKRLEMRLLLRKRLLSYVDFSSFPPPGMHVNGWPSQLWEALIANIDAKTLLYALAKRKRYNTRAFSSLIGETFFSELTLYDRRGQGTVTSEEFGHFLGTTVEKLHMRLDSARIFVYRTCRKTAYKLIDASDNTGDATGSEDNEITIIDQHFDTKERARVTGRKKEESVANTRNAVLRGSLGVRWEKARRNESKLLPTIRMGIDSTGNI